MTREPAPGVGLVGDALGDGDGARVGVEAEAVAVGFAHGFDGFQLGCVEAVVLAHSIFFFIFIFIDGFLVHLFVVVSRSLPRTCRTTKHMCVLDFAYVKIFRRQSRVLVRLDSLVLPTSYAPINGDPRSVIEVIV